jgi:hypothetical protein
VPHLADLLGVALEGEASSGAAASRGSEATADVEDAELAELLAEIEELSPEEVRRLLSEQNRNEASDG